ncbi:V-type ATP synthase subunit B [bacterium]|nr:V-type ATP synthase subunit B [bacterium]
MDREYIGINEAVGPLIFIENVDNVGYNELVEITNSQTGEEKLGVVLEVSEKMAIVEVFGGTAGLSLDKVKVKFKGKPFQIGVSRDMLGRVFDGLGNPIDNLPKPIIDLTMDVNGLPVNPTARDYPCKFIQTGLSCIDGMNTLIRGQKLPIFSGSGLPHNLLAAQIAQQAKIIGEKEKFVVVFAAMGVKHDVAQFFIDSFKEGGIQEKIVLFLSLADAPSIKRLITPRVALTAAEFLAFNQGMHVLVILTDMSNYCESLREISTLRGEIPARKGYPGYLYSDLANIYERAGMIKGIPGSITQIPILTMPNDDITHPIPDLTGYITEGQFILSRDLHRKGLFPPINVLPSLSSLMNLGIGENKTREDHRNLADQLYALYASGIEAKKLESIIGTEGMGKAEKRYLDFANKFEEVYINQGKYGRSIVETMNIGWELLSLIPEKDLVRVQKNFVEKYYNRNKKP